MAHFIWGAVSKECVQETYTILLLNTLRRLFGNEILAFCSTGLLDLADGFNKSAS